METLKLTISNMKSPHCQLTVTDAVNAVGGKIKSIAPSRAEIELTNQLTSETVIEAIRKAGYTVIHD